MLRLLARAVVVLVLCDLAVMGVRTWGSQTRVHVRVRESTAPTRTIEVLREGQAVVTGTVQTASVDAEVVDTIPTPFRVDAARAAIEGILVDGAREAAVWNGGLPLVIDGSGGGLDPSPAHVDVAPDTITVRLDGSARALLPGDYRTAAPVAVGGGGLATPRDGVAFHADAATTVTADGTVTLAPRPLRLDGPGRITVTGRLSIRTRDGERAATTLVFGPGPFQLALTPVAGGGWTITATVEGPFTAS